MAHIRDIAICSRDLEKASSQKERKRILLSKELWALLRDGGLSFARFGNDELDKAFNSKDGYIGESMGIDCYIQFVGDRYHG